MSATAFVDLKNKQNNKNVFLPSGILLFVILFSSFMTDFVAL